MDDEREPEFRILPNIAEVCCRFHSLLVLAVRVLKPLKTFLVFIVFALLSGCVHNHSADVGTLDKVSAKNSSKLSSLKPFLSSNAVIDHKNLNTDGLLLIAVRYEPVIKLPLAAVGNRAYRQQATYSLTNFTLKTLRQLSDQYAYDEVDRWPVKSLGLICIIVRPDSERAKQQLLSAVGKDQRIESAEPIRHYTTAASDKADPQVANVTQKVVEKDNFEDTYSHIQNYLNRPKLRSIHKSTTGKGVRIAIIDTGADLNHVELQSSFAVAKNFVDRDGKQFVQDIHGTAISGVIAATPNNHEGIIGLAPDSDLEIYKACWQLEKNSAVSACSSYTLAKAFAAIIDSKPDVVNMSITGPYDPLLAKLVAKMIDEDITLVAAASALDKNSGFPASQPGVFSIQAFGQTEALAGKSYIFAPGTDLFSTYPADKYDFYSGSSMSTAFVSGVIGLLKQADNRLSNEDLNKILISRELVDGKSEKIELIVSLMEPISDVR